MKTRSGKKSYPDAGKYVIPKSVPKYVPSFFDFVRYKTKQTYEHIKDLLYNYWDEYQITGKPRKQRNTGNKQNSDSKDKIGRQTDSELNLNENKAKQQDLVDSAYAMTREAMAKHGIQQGSDIVRGLDIIYTVAKESLDFK